MKRRLFADLILVGSGQHWHVSAGGFQARRPGQTQARNDSGHGHAGGRDILVLRKKGM
jgi:hypothetical protein